MCFSNAKFSHDRPPGHAFSRQYIVAASCHDQFVQFVQGDRASADFALAVKAGSIGEDYQQLHILPSLFLELIIPSLLVEGGDIVEELLLVFDDCLQRRRHGCGR